MSGNARLAACVAEAYKPRRPRSPKLSSVQATVIAGASRRGYSQTELAGIYGVSHTTIGRTISRQLREAADNQPIRAPHSGAFSMPQGDTK